jgi:hypothetical protein
MTVKDSELTFTIITGEAEEEYLEKAAADVMKIRSARAKSKKDRGKQRSKAEEQYHQK